MKKLIYWLRKLGILRTSKYVAKNSGELNKAVASDGGMIQSQKEIDEKYKQKEESNNKNKKSFGRKVL